MIDKYIHLSNIFKNKQEYTFSAWLKSKGYETYSRLTYMIPIILGKSADVEEVEKLAGLFLAENSICREKLID